MICLEAKPKTSSNDTFIPVTNCERIRRDGHDASPDMFSEL